MTPTSSVPSKLIQALAAVIKGKEEVLQLIVAALLADGHVLLEDFPGSGKTTLAKTLGALIKDDTAAGSLPVPIAPFKRIQFTPDMLPGDVLGVTVFDPESKSFRFVPGPIFGHVVLADELNRTGPKVQSAFLECLAEKQVTIDNVTYPLDKLFFVIGTQNPLETAGTYPLPLVQLDRFLFKVPMSYVDAKTEEEILANHHTIVKSLQSAAPVVTRSEVLQAREAVTQIHISEALRRTIVAIVQSTRNTPLLQFGLSTRAALALQQAVRAWSFVQGKSFADEDDLATVAPYVLMHRLRFNASAKDTKALFADLMKAPMEKLIAGKA